MGSASQTRASGKYEDYVVGQARPARRPGGAQGVDFNLFGMQQGTPWGALFWFLGSIL